MSSSRSGVKYGKHKGLKKPKKSDSNFLQDFEKKKNDNVSTFEEIINQNEHTNRTLRHNKRHRLDKMCDSSKSIFSKSNTFESSSTGVKMLQLTLNKISDSVNSPLNINKTFHVSSSEDEINNTRSFFDLVDTSSKFTSHQIPQDSKMLQSDQPNNTKDLILNSGQSLDNTTNPFDDNPFSSSSDKYKDKSLLVRCKHTISPKEKYNKESLDYKKIDNNIQMSSNSQNSTPLKSKYFLNDWVNTPNSSNSNNPFQLNSPISKRDASINTNYSPLNGIAKSLTIPSLKLSILALKINTKVLWAVKHKNVRFYLIMNFMSRSIKVMSTNKMVFEYSTKNNEAILAFKSIFESPLSNKDPSNNQCDISGNNTPKPKKSNLEVSIGIIFDMKHEQTLRVVALGTFKSRLEKITKNIVRLSVLSSKEHDSIVNIIGKHPELNVTLSSDSEAEPIKSNNHEKSETSTEKVASVKQIEDSEFINKSDSAQAPDFELNDDNTLKNPIPLDSIDTNLDSDSDFEQNKLTRRDRKPETKLEDGDLILFRFPFTSTTSIHVSKQDYMRLKDGEFLNDTLIDFYLRFLTENLKKSNPDLENQVFIYSSFFYELYCKYSKQEKEKRFDSVRKWTSKNDILSKKYLFVPINKNYHWFLALVINPNRLIKKNIENSEGSNIEPNSVDDDLTNTSNDNRTDSVEILLKSDNTSESINDNELKYENKEYNSTSNPLEPTNSSFIDSNVVIEKNDKAFYNFGNCSDEISENKKIDTKEIISLSDLKNLIQQKGYENEQQSIEEVNFGENVKSHENSPTDQVEQERIQLDEIQRETNAIEISKKASKTVSTDEIHIELSENAPNAQKLANSSISTQNAEDEILDDIMIKKYWFRGSSEQSFKNSGKKITETSSHKKIISDSTEPDNFKNTKNYIDLDLKTWIVIFDSLGGRHRSVIENLNAYIRSMVSDITGLDADGIIQGIYAKVPRQSNYSDCGLYLLQYVEEFMKDPSVLEKLVNRVEMQRWFSLERMHKKRSELKNLCGVLTNKYKESTLTQKDE
ncbi:hypothetical protein BB561_002908 [Smittium simulii]|uniref:Ubiquitin-like protease family profile domain-containing protein n=1 Tax=Smittium simulii TaxID=133385 RepID=A0A2T9YNN2_9FUNG|nr:hypothetical protein BB561_002908 [Smittium simulii]